MESCTALVEHFDGRFEILEWRKQPETLPAEFGREFRKAADFVPAE